MPSHTNISLLTRTRIGTSEEVVYNKYFKNRLIQIYFLLPTNSAKIL